MNEAKARAVFLAASAGISRSVRFLAALAVVAGLGASAAPSAIQLVDLDGRAVDPFQASDAQATVFLFVRTDCPISNRYAPEIARLHEAFTPRGVRFWLVYGDPDETAEMVRAHLREYSYPCGALRDPQHALIERTGVRVTPEVAVYSRAGVLVYRGRIDDRYVALGKARPAANTHDLAEVLDAVLAGRPVANRITRAVGCSIADLK